MTVKVASSSFPIPPPALLIPAALLAVIVLSVTNSVPRLRIPAPSPEPLRFPPMIVMPKRFALTLPRTWKARSIPFAVFVV